MSQHKHFKNESQDARRKDQQKEVHPNEKLGKALHKEKKEEHSPVRGPK